MSVTARDSTGTVVDSGASAIDVSGDWSKFPRYGYAAHYDSGLDATNLMAQLKNYHLNRIQFYDWQWKHHNPPALPFDWTDSNAAALGGRFYG